MEYQNERLVQARLKCAASKKNLSLFSFIYSSAINIISQVFLPKVELYITMNWFIVKKMEKIDPHKFWIDEGWTVVTLLKRAADEKTHFEADMKFNGKWTVGNHWIQWRATMKVFIVNYFRCLPYKGKTSRWSLQ